MPRRDADRNLLFGILALQMDLITRDALIAAMGAWALAKHRPIGEILVEAGALDAVDRAALEPMIDRRIAREGGDPARSLAALSSVASLAADLRRSIADPDVLDSLASVAQGRPGDAYATRSRSSFEPPRSGVRYRKVRDHAKGGLGVVFVARDEELNREVALKEIQDRHADDPNSRARFLIEAEVTGGLEHPGIVPVYGLGSYEDGRPFYAMRFIKGDSLKDAVARFHSDERLKKDPGPRALELQKLLRRFLDVCNAMSYAHSRGVLHRDLKPDNVMIGKYGETLVVDWGLAKTSGRSGDVDDASLPESTLRPASASGSHETQPGAVIGTPAYMSPEQATGRIDLLGFASDVYSLGATLYTLLTGRCPFVDRDLGEVLRKVERGDFLRPGEVLPWLDPALEAICLKAMTLKPEGRYPSPRAMADDVDRWLAGEPVLCWKEPVVRRMRRWVGRNRTLVTSSVSLMATAVVALGIALAFINAEKIKFSEESRLRGIAVKEKSAALATAEEARGKEAEAASRAKAEAAKVLGVIDVLVNTFRASDPIGLEGLGVRKGSESVEMLSARDILDRSAQLVDKSLGDQPLVRATLMDTLGEVYRSRMEFEKADRLLRSALEARTGSLAWDDPELATSMIHMGWLHQDRGQFDEAERYFRDAVRRRTARFGADDYQTLDAKARLAILWMLAEEDEKAESAFREVIQKLSAVVGDGHRDVAIARLGLAAVYLNVGRMPEAYLQTRRGMNVLLSKADSERFFLAVGKFQRGLGLGALKQYRPAERLLREGMESLREFLGPDHPYLSFFLHEIGEIQEAQGKLVEAEASFRASVDLIRRSVGFRYPKARTAVDGLGTVLEKMGRYEDARKLYQELVEVRRAAFGREHVWVADALVSFADGAGRHGDGPEQLRMLQEALAIYRKRTGREPALFAQCLNNLAARLLKDGSFREAEPLLREVVPLARKQFGPSSENVGIALHNLARCLTPQGRDDEETDRLFAEAIAILRSPLGSYQEAAVVALTELADSEQRRGLHDRAEAHAREALEACRVVCGGQPAKVAVIARGLAVVIARRGDLGRAIPVLEESAALSRSASPKDSAGLVEALSQSALLRAAGGDMAASREAAALLLRDSPPGEDPDLLNDVTWAVSRFSGKVTDAAALEALARRVLAARPGDRSHRLTGSVALLRAGRHEEAALLLEDLRRGDTTGFVTGNLYLAIAYRKLGRPGPSDEARGRAMASISQLEKTMSWDLSLQLRILRQEVDALSLEPSGELPTNVFAPDRE